MGGRHTHLVGSAKFHPIIVSVETPVFCFTITVGPRPAEQVPAGGICLRFSYFGINRAVIVCICPQLECNIGNTALSGILNTVVICILPDEISNFEGCGSRVSVNISQPDTLPEGECITPGILIKLVWQRGRSVENIEAEQSARINLSLNGIYVG